MSATELKYEWHTRKAKAKEQFLAQGLPSKKHEAWKYTQLNKLPQEQLLADAVSTDVNVPSALQPALDTHYRIVFVDGILSASLSTFPSELVVMGLEELAHYPEFKTQVESLLVESKDFDEQSDIELNTAGARQVVLFGLQKNVQLDKPLELHYCQTDSNGINTDYSQPWLLLSDNCQMTLIERFYGNQSTLAKHSLQQVVLRVKLAKDANLAHYRIQQAADDVHHLYNAYVSMADNASYRSFCWQSGGTLSRQAVYVAMNGVHGVCEQNGLVLGRDRQHHDTYLPVLHANTNCYSSQKIRQLLAGRAKGIFYGTVNVPRDSIKTEAHQQNHNLLLSDTAQAYTRPELDILTDDVVCSHGATVGNVDEEALYYLQARGLDESSAMNLLVEAFANSLLEEIPCVAIRQLLQQDLVGWTLRER